LEGEEYRTVDSASKVIAASKGQADDSGSLAFRYDDLMRGERPDLPDKRECFLSGELVVGEIRRMTRLGRRRR